MINTRCRVLITILVLVGSCVACYSSPGVTVYLHTSASIDGPAFTLGQVASVVSSDPAQAEALRQLPLGLSPDRPTLLPARAIQERIAATTADAVVIGGRIALLPADVIPANEQWFYTALLAFVEQQDTYKQGRIEIELPNPPLLLEGYRQNAFGKQGTTAGWQDRILFETEKSPYSSGFKRSATSQVLPAGTMEATYRILVPEGADAIRRAQVEGSLRIWIHHFLPIARAAIDLSVDQLLSEDVLIFAEEDISLLRSSFFLQGEEVGNYRPIASIRRGDRIEGDRLQRSVAVRAGDRVRITFARPGLLVSLPGRAFRSGSIGDLIDVRTEATTKRFRARITSKGEVFVESH